jgi:hypothetical protein
MYDPCATIFLTTRRRRFLSFPAPLGLGVAPVQLTPHGAVQAFHGREGTEINKTQSWGQKARPAANWDESSGF